MKNALCRTFSGMALFLIKQLTQFYGNSNGNTGGVKWNFIYCMGKETKRTQMVPKVWSRPCFLWNTCGSGQAGIPERLLNAVEAPQSTLARECGLPKAKGSVLQKRHF